MLNTPSKLLAALRRRALRNSLVAEAYARAYQAPSPLSFSAQDRLLADAVQMKAYARAIAKYVRPNDVVVDAGGSGVLALLAAKQGADVYALCKEPSARIARQVAQSNSMTNIRWVSANRRGSHLDVKADVILHEIPGATLFENSLMPNIAALRNRVLKSGGRILPHLLELYAEPVELRSEYRMPFLWEEEIEGITFSAARQFSGRMSPDYFFRTIRPEAVRTQLCTPSPAMGLDLLSAGPKDVQRRLYLKHCITKQGALDGYVVYFRAGFDEKLWIATGPGAPRTHWPMLLLREARRMVASGDTLTLELELARPEDALSWRWSSRHETNKLKAAPSPPVAAAAS